MLLRIMMLLSSFLCVFAAQGCCHQAEVNVKFLSILKEPCEELAQLKPKEVAPKLKHIISLIRIIWDNNSYYSSSERIIGLFHMVPALYTHTGATNTQALDMKLGRAEQRCIKWCPCPLL